MITAIVFLIILLIISIIDLKIKAIPSFFLTGFILVALLVTSNPLSLFLGICAFVYALALYELNFISGIADIKIISLVGILLSSYFSFILFMILLVYYGLFYKMFFRFVLKKDEKEEIPFILCICFVYASLLLVGGIS